jgi:tetratricopeptide (TPR) repeat protein
VLIPLLGEKSKPDPAQIERAADWMQNALDAPGQQPKSSLLRVGLANLRERQKQFNEAKKLYDEDIKQGGGDVVSLNNLAWLMILTDAKAGITALDLINRATARKGPLPELLDTRGVIYLKTGDSHRAISDLQKAAAGAPTAAKYFHLAQAYLEAKDKPAAKQNLKKALEAGLTPESLHPLEVEAGDYQRVRSAIEEPGA